MHKVEVYESQNPHIVHIPRNHIRNGVLENPPFLIVAICQNSRKPPADYMCHERCLQAETVFRICKATNEENDKHNL